MNVMKLRHVFLSGVVLIFLAGCGTMQYTPQQYPLRDGLIPALSINGSVKVNNAQPSTDQAIVYSYGGSKLASNYKDITQLMVDQTSEEIKKNGKYSNSGKRKTVDLKVTHLLSKYVAFYWKSELKYTAVLGNETTIDKTVRHGSGVLVQDLNGCIAESVMDLLNDPRVVAYLAE